MKSANRIMKSGEPIFFFFFPLLGRFTRNFFVHDRKSKRSIHHLPVLQVLAMFLLPLCSIELFTETMPAYNPVAHKNEEVDFETYGAKFVIVGSY